MDSLKKGSEKGNKSSLVNIPLAIRFNAEEESIEEFIKPTTEIPQNSNSPQQEQQKNEDFSWKIFQENLFNRNKSGSIENIPSSSFSGSHSILSSSSDINTIGTWKLIKGKVSQAMEDIKSSKNLSTSSKIETSSIHNDESDQETNINIATNDKLQTDFNQHLLSTPSSVVSQIKLGALADSDSDLDIESNDDNQSSSISFRKSLANLRSKSYIKSKVKSSKRKQLQQRQENPPKKDESPNILLSSSFPSTKSESFLKRRKFDSKRNENKKDNEIESGIEVVEDMMITSSSSNRNSIAVDDGCVTKESVNNDDSRILGISFSDETITFKNRPRNDTADLTNKNFNDLEENKPETHADTFTENLSSPLLLKRQKEPLVMKFFH